VLACAFPVRIAAVAVLAAIAVAHLESPRREYALFAGTVATLFLDPLWYVNEEYEHFLTEALANAAISARVLERLLTLALMAGAAGVFVWAAKRPQSSLSKHPVSWLLTVLTVTTLIGLYGLQPSLSQVWLIAAIKILAAYMWFICYGIVDQRSAKRQPLQFSLGTLRGFWCSYSPPIGKGAAYLARVRCRGAEELAVTQLKALKLLLWSFVMFWMSHGMQDVMCTAGRR
jgi:hypothetical protein